jgi:SYP5 family syntaxin
MSKGGDSWTREYAEVKASCDEVYELIRERNSLASGSASGDAREQDVHRLSSQCRRKLQTLSSKIGSLENSLNTTATSSNITQREASRRTEMVHSLRLRRDQLKDMMSRDSSRQSERTKLLGSGSASSSQRGVETDATAGLDSQGIVQMQKQALRSQDDQIEELGKAVRNTKHVALAINDEVDLQARLLDDLDSAVDHTESYMKFARRKLEQVSRKSGSCKYILVIILLMVLLAVIISMSKMLTS